MIMNSTLEMTQE